MSAQRICTQLSRYNPLFIYGGVGLGKTHLINSIGLKLRENNNVMFISAERFMYQFIKSIKKNEMVNFKDFFRKANVFIIDDIQFIRGKEGLQEEFFHTFNSLFDKSSQIVISSDRAPNKLDRVQDRIKSRLSGGLVVDIGVPDYELKLKILKIHFHLNQEKTGLPGSNNSVGNGWIRPSGILKSKNRMKWPCILFGWHWRFSWL